MVGREAEKLKWDIDHFFWPHEDFWEFAIGTGSSKHVFFKWCCNIINLFEVLPLLSVCDNTGKIQKLKSGKVHNKMCQVKKKKSIR